MALSEEIAKEIVVAFCSRLKDIPVGNLESTQEFGATEIGQALGTLYAEVVKVIRNANG
jgi:hypothetical protein